ncbi:MAG TPA: 3-methyl-2-oxobutanoate hydroxymethyltransferase, partial [Candidatus Nitrosocosmicus sp.]|nr:3-methyl-2-oxobutanoate hydroxymethyltransferase [Candidatus Nitrosocosmicus sp.]
MRISINDIIRKKSLSEKISVVTAYDYSIAKICDASNIDIILVGDSAGMVMLGYESTIPVTIEDMIVFCKGVINGSKRSLVVADMPFGSYHSDMSLALSNAVKFIKLGCNAVKIEGGSEVVPIIREFTNKGIPVMGHIGLKPQTLPLWQGYRIQGKTVSSAIDLLDDAIQLEKAGAFSLVLEMVTAEIAGEISKELSIPTIGIGSGSSCDGQVLVLHDMLGLYDDIKPKFVKRYLDSNSLFSNAIANYVRDIKTGSFPDVAHS